MSCRPRRWILVTATLLGTGLGGGCSSMNHTEKGMAVGSGLGAGIGALAGSTHGKAGAGALIGAAAGAIGGALVGNGMDKDEKRASDIQLAEAQAAAAPFQGTLSPADIVQLTAQGVGDTLIINQITSTGSTYNLSAGDLAWLKQNNVSDAVITAMQNTRHKPASVVVQPPPRVIYSRPQTVIVREPVYVVPPPPPAFGFGFSYSRIR